MFTKCIYIYNNKKKLDISGCDLIYGGESISHTGHFIATFSHWLKDVLQNPGEMRTLYDITSVEFVIRCSLLYSSIYI